MNILFLNNYHYLRGGSERVFFGEMELLRSRGHRVVSFARRHSSDVPSVHQDLFPPDFRTDSVRLSPRAAMETLWSRDAARAIDLLLDREAIDLAHAHNVYGRLTRSVLAALRRRGVPVVLTLHDYKLVCPTYRLMRDGHVCEDCRSGRYWRAVTNRCHKESVLGSGLVALESYVNDRFWRDGKNVRCLVAPSRFLRDKFVELGFDGRRIVHVPNFVDASAVASARRGRAFLFVGRLSGEKGVATLLRAFREVRGQASLKIAGTGPLGDSLRRDAAADSRVELLGHLDGDALARTIGEARAVVVPSEWYENAPLSLLEAYAHRTPVVAARIGGLPEHVVDGETGFLFESGNAVALAAALERVAALPDARIEDMGHAARRFVEEHHSPDAHVDRLVAIYEDVCRGLPASVA